MMLLMFWPSNVLALARVFVGMFVFQIGYGLGFPPLNSRSVGFVVVTF